MDENRYDELLKAAFRENQQAPESWMKNVEEIYTAEKPCNKSGKRLKSLIAAVILAIAVPICAYAGFQFLTAGDVAHLMDDAELAKAFHAEKNQIVTVEDGEYAISLIGFVGGEAFRNFEEFDTKVFDRTGMSYAAFAIQRKDGRPIENYGQAEFYVTLLIEGFDPMEWNSALFGNSTRKILKDGVLYYIAECDQIAIFADHRIYAAVIEDGLCPGRDAVNFNEDNGKISANRDYEKANVLFELAFDPTKAEPAEAARFIAEHERKFLKEDNSLHLEMQIGETEKDGISFRICDGRVFPRDEKTVQCDFSFYVSGENIKTVQLKTSDGKLLQPEQISKDEFEKLKSAKDIGNAELLATQGKYFLIDYRKAAAQFDVDFRRLSKELYHEDAIKFFAERSELEKARLEIVVTKTDGSKVRQRVQIDKMHDVEIKYVTYKFI